MSAKHFQIGCERNRRHYFANARWTDYVNVPKSLLLLLSIVLIYVFKRASRHSDARPTVRRRV